MSVKHILRMIIGCALPLLLLFLAPAFGLSSNISFFIFMLAMFACHLLMPMHHGKHNHEHQYSESSKKETHEHD